jgi:hypothetical protein
MTSLPLVLLELEVKTMTLLRSKADLVKIDDGRKDRTYSGGILEIELNFSMPLSSDL